MPKSNDEVLVTDLIGIYGRTRNIDDFVAICLYRKIGEETKLRFYYNLIQESKEEESTMTE